MKSDYLNVPVPIFVYAMKTSRYKEIRLWLFLKLITSGHFKLKGILVKHIIWQLDIKSRSTLTKYMEWLLKKKWITYNSVTGNYRLRSLAKVSNKINQRVYVGAVTYLDDLLNLKGFTYGVLASVQIKRIEWSRRKKTMRAGSFSRTARKSRGPSTPKSVYCPLANEYLSKAFGIPASTLSDAKQEAKHAGYISVKPQFEELEYVQPSEVRHFRKYVPELRHLTQFHDGKIVLRRADNIKSHVILRIVKKLKT